MTDDERDKLVEEAMNLDPEVLMLAMKEIADKIPEPPLEDLPLIFQHLAARHDVEHLQKHLDAIEHGEELHASFMPNALVATHEEYFGDTPVTEKLFELDNLPSDPFFTSFVTMSEIRFLSIFFRCGPEREGFASWTAWNKGRAQKRMNWRLLPYEVKLYPDEEGHFDRKIDGVSELLFFDAVDLVKFARTGIPARESSASDPTGARKFFSAEIVASLATAMVEIANPGACLGKLKRVH